MVEVQQSISMPLSPMTSIHPHLSHPKYRADIDGLRAIAVLSVVAFHAFPNWLKGGFAGVDVFFVISGFLISTVIFENLDRGTFNFAEFYARRIKRIFPALLLVLIASFTFGWFALLADEYRQLGKHMAAGAGFVSNLVLWSEAGYFDSSAEIKPLLHLWSLGIEEQFYIFWPLLLWLAWRQKFNLLTITILVAIVSFVVNINEVKQDTVATFYSPLTRFWELLSGSLLAWATIYKTVAFRGVKTKLDGWMGTAIFKQAPEPDGKTLSNVLSFVGLFLLGYGFWRINKEFSFPGKWALVPVLGAVLLIAAGPKAWVNRTILSNKITVWFGLISFPLYLWHWPLLSFARIIESEVPSRNIRIAAVALSIALAWLTLKLVERRVRLGGHNKVKVVTLVVLMTIVCYIGYNTYSRDGLKFRNAAKVGLANDFAWPSSFRDTCKKITESKDSGGWCNDGNIEDDPKVLLLGDSYATSYSQLFYFYSKNNNLTYKQYGVGQCPPLLDFGPTACSDAAKFYLESLRNSPATEYVVLAAAWFSYVNGKNSRVRQLLT
jgi:peptidoglycan/LPS O-acetylase OafA/YrhL